MRKLNRNIVVSGSVVLFHIAALWALQAGLQRPREAVIPVYILSEFVRPTEPKIESAPPPPQAATRPAPRAKEPPPRKAERPPAPATRPEAPPEPPPASSSATTGLPSPQPIAPLTAVPTAREPAAPAAAPALPRVELPSSGASYLDNPAPVYPPISKRLGEQGKVVVRVLIGADGRPQGAEIRHSSGFDRLDRAAMEYVMRCRYVPGKVGGVPQAMWYEAPVNFVLE